MIRRVLSALGVVCLSGLSAPGTGQAQEAPGPSMSMSGGVYLFYYVPTMDGATDYFETYAFMLNVDAASSDGRYGFHSQARARDSKLRSFFLSNNWLQEAYVYRATEHGHLRVGKVYRKVGLFWDDSFFGNVQYFNGLKLNPEYGAEFVGRRDTASGTTIDYSVQAFPNNDHVAGAAAGRDVESDPGAVLNNAFTARVAPTFKLGEGATLGLGLSAFRGEIKRAAGGSFDLQHFAVDATVSAGPWAAYGEFLVAQGEKNDAAHPLSRPGYDDANYILVGTKYQIAPRVSVRVNVSQADYDGAKSTEREIVPGITAQIDDHLTALVEYDHWKIEPDSGPETTIDTSWNFILYYGF